MQLPPNLSGMPTTPQAQETAPPETPAPGQDQNGPRPGQERASPEEQSLYNDLVGTSLKALWEKKNLPAMIDVLSSSKDPRQGVARLTGALVQRVVSEAMRSGQGPIPASVLMAGLEEITENVMELAEKAGGYKFSQDPRMARAAAILAFDTARTHLQSLGAIDDAEMQAGLQEMLAADKQGSLAQMLGVTQDDLAAGDPGQGMNLEDDQSPPEEAAPMNRQQRRAAERRAAKEARRNGN